MTEKVVIGNCELWHGDCREVLPQLGEFDLILTDPPYGIAHKWKGGFGHGWGKAREKAELRNEWDAEAPDLGFLLSMLGEKIVWGGNHFALPASRCWLVWRKEINPALTLGDAELAWTTLDKTVRVFDHPRNKLTGDKVPPHPTQKPLRLMAWCLSLVPDAETVCDPYMGSGTTGVACAMLGKTFTGIERERKYFDIACERIARAQAQGQLLPPEPPALLEQQGMAFEP